MNNTQNKALREFDILEKTVKDALILPFKDEILALVDKFGESGQSGGSAPYTAGAIAHAVKKLCLNDPICDVVGTDEEWVDVSEGMGKKMYQNNRCTGLFKDKDGVSYIDAIVFQGDITGGFTGNGSVSLKNGKKIGSSQKIKGFPFKPKTFHIDVIETEWADKKESVKKEGGGWWTSVVKDEEQLKEVAEYYDLEL
jgi:hypothetical protein